MNILYIGNFYELGSNSRGCRERLNSLRKAGAKVKYKNIGINKHKYVEKIDNEDLREFDCIIQHEMPLYYTYDCRFLCVSQFDWPLDNFFDSNFKMQLNAMDLCIVSSDVSVKSYLNSGVTNKISKIPMPTDCEIYEKEYDCPKYIKKYIDEDYFIFYTISGENNFEYLKDVLFSYYSEFSEKDKVCLIIKTDGNHALLKNLIESIVEKIKTTNRPEVICIAQEFKIKDIRALHKFSSCYIEIGRGQNWHYDAMDALGFGSTPIVIGGTSCLEFVTKDNGWIMDFDTEPCIGLEDLWGGTYRCNQKWNRPLISAVKNTMREVFENRNLWENKSSRGLADTLRFNSAELGTILLEAIHHAKKENLERLR